MNTSNEIELTQSQWLRDAKTELLLRDPIDALNDAEALVLFSQKRLEAMICPTKLPYL